MVMLAEGSRVDGGVGGGTRRYHGSESGEVDVDSRSGRVV